MKLNLRLQIVKTVAEPTSRSVNDLNVFPWGGITSNGITLVNICPVDSTDDLSSHGETWQVKS